MSEPSLDEWYFTRAGATEGPVSFSELKVKVGNYMLRPPVDMVWSKGLEKWKSVTDVPELAETRGTPLPNSFGKAVADGWFYLVDRKPTGPISLEEMKRMVADLTLEPPVKLVWTGSMNQWMPVYEVAVLCEAVQPKKPAPTGSKILFKLASTATVSKKSPYEARKPTAELASPAEQARVIFEEKTRIKAQKVEAKEDARAQAVEAIRIIAREEDRVAAEKAAAEKAAADKAAADKAAADKAAADKAAADKAAAEAETAAKMTAAGDSAVIERERAADAKKSKPQPSAKLGGKNIWYYTNEGDRLGPVSFELLREMATAATLNPRMDLVWKGGMAEWKPAGQIDGIFARAADLAPAQHVITPPAVLYRPQQLHDTVSQFGKDAGWPGVRRRLYLPMVFLFPMLWALILGTAAEFLQAQFGERLMGMILPVAALVPIAVIIAVTLKRFQNLGMSSWWFFGNLVPVLNLWVSYRLWACPAGYAYHKKMDGPGIFLALVYGLLLLLGILVFAGTIAVLTGAVGSPELRQHVQEALRQADASSRVR